MKRSIQVGLAIVCSITLATAGTDKGPKTGTILTMPETSWHKRSGEFLVHLAVSTQGREFVRAWQSDSKSVTPVLYDSPITTTPTDVEFVVFLAFANCPLTRGKCEARVTYQILSPEGKILVEHSNLPLWDEQAPPDKNRLQMATFYWYSQAESSDPSGDYLLRALVNENEPGKKITLERTLRHP
jgi:hypothetical protein